MRRRAAAAGAAVIGTAVAGYILLVRRWQLRWGATDEECDTALPGDDLIANPDLVATRAITVPAAAEQVWPWIAQLGQGRGGFYSYDALENLVGCNIHSADQIGPPVAGHHRRRPGQAPPGGWARHRGGGTGPSAGPARWRAHGRRAAPLRLHLGVCRAGAAGGDDPAAGPRAVWVHAAVGAVAGRAGCGGRLRDDPTNALRDQGSCRTRWPANGVNWARGR